MNKCIMIDIYFRINLIQKSLILIRRSADFQFSSLRYLRIYNFYIVFDELRRCFDTRLLIKREIVSV